MSEMLERRAMMYSPFNVPAGLVTAQPPAGGSPALIAEPAASPTFPLSSVPQLSSLPSAPTKLYLNFAGDNVPTWKTFSPGAIPAYDIDGDPTTFSQTELDDIKLIWAVVADKYSPFNLDVTTIKPASTAHGVTEQMDIGGTGSWYNISAGGVNTVGGFTNTSVPNLGFVFSSNSSTSSTDINFLGTTVAHEAGHGFGLQHQGSQNSNGSLNEYSNGSSTTVPIMGNANNLPTLRGIWFNGLQTTANASGGVLSTGANQDDLSILSNSTNGFGYRADDWTMSDYEMMSFDSTGNLNSGFGGVIGNTSDDDPFGFQATNSTAYFTISQPTQFGMLAPSAVIETPQGSVVATSNNNNFGCTITATNLIPGNIYLLDVKSQGGYGDIGSYQIGGWMRSFAYVSGVQLIVDGFGDNPNNITISGGAGSDVLTDAFTGGATTLTFPSSGILAINVSLGAGNDSLNIGGGSLANLQGITIDTGAGTDSVALDDSSSTAMTSYLLGTSGSVGGTAYAGSGNVIEFYTSVESVTLKTSKTTGDSVKIAGTVDPISVVGDGSETVDVGAGNMQSVAAPVTLSNPPAYSQVTLDDSGDAIPRTATLAGASITGLSPASITWTPGDTSALTIDGGSGGNAFYGQGITGNFTTTINMGAGNDRFINSNAGAGTFQINGQAGVDLAQFVDTSATAAAAYTFSANGFTRSGLSGYVDSTTESLQLLLGGGGSVVSIPALPASTAVAIFGTGGTQSTSNTYNIGTGSHVLPSFGGGLDIEDLVGVGTITLDDSGRSAYTTANVTGNTWSSNTTVGQLTYTVRKLVYDTDSASSQTNILSTTSNTAYAVNGGGGVNFLDVGAGSLANVTTSAGITFNGGGTNYLTIDDSLDAVGQTYNLSQIGVTVSNGLSVTFATNVSSTQLYGGAGNDTFNIPTTPSGGPIGIYPDGGNNAVLVSAAGSLGSVVTVNGSSGSTALTYDDIDDGSYQLSANAISERILTTDAALVKYSNLSFLAININNGGSGQTFNVSGTAAGTPVTVNENSGTITINVNQTSPTGPVIVFPSSGNDPVNVDAPGQGTGPASVVYSLPQQTGIMNIGSAGLVTISGPSKFALYSTGLTATGNGTIDLTTNDYGVINATLASVTALAKTGLNLAGGGRWNGPGITSSAAAADTSHLTAVAVVQNNQSGMPLFSGSKTFDGSSPGAANILVKYTYFGDANIDGKVDGSDYTLIDGGYKNHLTGWFNGDFNYDGVVDGSDYALIDNAFNNQRTAIASAIVAPAAAALKATPAAPAPPTARAATAAAVSPWWAGSAQTETNGTADWLKNKKRKTRLN